MSDPTERHIARQVNNLIEQIGDQRITDITKQHSFIAGAIGLIPVPLIGIPCILGNLYTMYGRINERLEIKFTDNIIKSISGMLVSNLTMSAAGAGGYAVCQVLKFIPVIGTTIGGAGEMAVNYAITSVSGKLYCEWLKKICSDEKSINNIDSNQAKKVMEEVINSNNIKEMMNEAKKETNDIDFTKYKDKAQELVDKEKKRV